MRSQRLEVVGPLRGGHENKAYFGSGSYGEWHIYDGILRWEAACGYVSADNKHRLR